VPGRTVRAGSNTAGCCIGPGGVFALGHLERDVDILGGIVPGGADALDHGGEAILIPIHPFRQIGDHGEIAIVEADRAGVLARRLPLLGGAGGVADGQRGIEAGLRGLVALQRFVDSRCRMASSSTGSWRCLAG
jgi:hypothetical protein